jgi:site-specific recombinase XerD
LPTASRGFSPSQAADSLTEKLVPVFTSEELPALEKTCQGRTFARRRDAAIIAVLTATGMFSRGANQAYRASSCPCQVSG